MQFYSDTILLFHGSWLFWEVKAIFLASTLASLRVFTILPIFLPPSSCLFILLFFHRRPYWVRLHCQIFHAADRSRCHLGFFHLSSSANKKLWMFLSTVMHFFHLRKWRVELSVPFPNWFLQTEGLEWWLGRTLPSD